MADAFYIVCILDLAGNVTYEREIIYTDAGININTQIVAFHGNHVVPPTSDLEDLD